MKVYGVDTHALWWYLTNDIKLSKAAKIALDDPAAIWLVSTIVLCELKWAYLKGKFHLDTHQIVKLLNQTELVIIRPVTNDIVSLLPAGLEMHDGLICATCIEWQLKKGHTAALITKDPQIVQAGILPTVW